MHLFLRLQQFPVTSDASYNLKGPESISLHDIDAEFARLEDIRNAEKMMDMEFLLDWDVDRKEVLEGNAFDFAELQHVDEGLVPAAVEDEIMVTDHDANETYELKQSASIPFEV